jgi:hypothetical protein
MKKQLIQIFASFALAFVCFDAMAQYQIEVTPPTGSSKKYRIKVLSNGMPLADKTLVYYRFSDGYTMTSQSVSPNPLDLVYPRNQTNSSSRVAREFEAGTHTIYACVAPKGGPVGYASTTVNVSAGNASSVKPTIDMHGKSVLVTESWKPYPSAFGVATDDQHQSFTTPTDAWFYLDVTLSASYSGDLVVSFPHTEMIVDRVVVQNGSAVVPTTPTSTPIDLDADWTKKITYTADGQLSIKQIIQTILPVPVQKHILLIIKSPSPNNNRIWRHGEFLNNIIVGDNLFIFNTKVQGGPHDPNEIDVPPAVCAKQANPAKWKYRVKFQNNGNASATNVKIEPHLNDNYLAFSGTDLFQVIGSSHGVNSWVEALDANGEIIFTYPNINLPGSNEPGVNYADSEGWVDFEVTSRTCLGANEALAYATITFLGSNGPSFLDTQTRYTNITSTSYINPNGDGSATICTPDASCFTGDSPSNLVMNDDSSGISTSNPIEVVRGANDEIKTSKPPVSIVNQFDEPVISRGPTYCTASALNNCTVGDEYISNVSTTGTNPIINKTTVCNGTTYSDFTGTVSTTVVAGSTFGLMLGNPAFFPNNEYRVWVDWNQDGDFIDIGEEYVPLTLGQIQISVNFTIAVPVTALNGSTRMRVRMTYNSSADPIRPCDVFNFGETEDYTLIVSNGALPIVLKIFSAKALTKTNLIEWTTATELNTKWHIVERSKNGISDWKEIGKLAAAGNSTAEINYTLEDKQPLTIGYYRLRTEDFDGQVNFSNIVSVTRESKQFNVSNVFPSPAVDKVTVEYETTSEGLITLRVYDIVGREVYNQPIETQIGVQQTEVPLQTLASGLYIIQLINTSESTAPIVIMKR